MLDAVLTAEDAVEALLDLMLSGGVVARVDGMAFTVAGGESAFLTSNSFGFTYIERQKT